MEEENNRTGEIVVLTAILTGGLVFLIYAYRSKLLAKAKDRIIKMINSTNPKAYDKEDRNQIKRLVRKYSNMVAKAKDKIDVYEAKEAFEEALSDFRTSAKKLADSKIDALRDIYEFGMDKYGKPGSEKLNDFARKYAEQIRHAANLEHVRELRDEFMEKAHSFVNRQEA
jgi:hypothetical protein